MAEHELLVKLGLESSSFTRNIRNVNNQLKLTEAEFKQLESGTKNFGRSVNDLKAKMKSLETTTQQLKAKSMLYNNEIKKIKTNIDEQKRKHDNLSNSLKKETDKLERLKAKYGELNPKVEKQQKTVAKLQEQYDKSTRKIENFNNSLQRNKIGLAENETKLNKVGNELDKLAFKVKSFKITQISKTFDGLSKKFESIGSKLTSMGRTLTAGLTTPLVGAGTAAVMYGAKFETAMDKVGALSRASADDMKLLEAKAREMGETTSFTAKDAADALGYMALAGWDTNQMLSSIEPVLRLAEAGEMDLALASDLVTDSMSTLGLKTGDLKGYLDMVALSAAESNQSVEQMLRAYVQVGGSLERFNVPLNESGALLGVLANRGIKAEQAGRSLSSIMINLIKPTGESAKAMKELGVSAYDSKGNFKGVEQTLLDLDEALNATGENGLPKYTNAQKDAYKAMIGGKTQIRTLDALFSGLKNKVNGNTTEFQALKEELSHADGALAQMAKTMKDNIQGDWDQLTSALGETAIQITEMLAPAIRDFLQYLTDLVRKFNDLDEGTKEMILKFAGIAAAIGPVILTVGLLGKAFGAAFGTIATMGKGLVAFGKTMWDVGKAVGEGMGVFKAFGATIVGFPVIIGVAVTALVGIMSVIGENESVLASLQEKWGEFGTFVGGVCEAVAGIVQLVIGNAIIILGTLGKIIGKIVTFQWNEIDDVFNEGWAKVQANTNKAWDNITVQSTNAIAQMREMTSKEFEGISHNFEVILKELPNLTYDTVDSMAEKFANSFEGMSEKSISIMSSTSDNLNMLFRGIHEGMDNKAATKQYEENLKVMARLGGVSVDELRSDIDKSLKLINDNMADSNTRFAREAKGLGDTLKKATTIGIKEASGDVANEISNMNINTVQQLSKMSDDWGRVFKGLKLDGSESTKQMADTIYNNLNIMAQRNPQLVSKLVDEMNQYLEKLPKDAKVTMDEYSNAVSNGSQGAQQAASGTGDKVKEELKIDAEPQAQEDMQKVANAITNGGANVTNAAQNVGNQTVNSYAQSMTGMDTATQNALNNQSNKMNSMGTQNYNAMANNANSAVNGFVETWDSNQGRINESINNTFNNFNRLNTISWGSTTKALSEIQRWLGVVSGSSTTTLSSLQRLTSLSWGNTTRGLSQVNMWIGRVKTAATSCKTSLDGMTRVRFGNTTKGLSEITKWLKNVSTASNKTRGDLTKLTTIRFGGLTKQLSEVNRWLGVVSNAANNARSKLASLSTVRYGGITSQLSQINRWLNTVKNSAHSTRNALASLSSISLPKAVSYRVMTVQKVVSKPASASIMPNSIADGFASLKSDLRDINFSPVDMSNYKTSISKDEVTHAYNNANARKSKKDDVTNDLVKQLMQQNELLMQLVANTNIQLNTYLDGRKVASATAPFIKNEIESINNRKNRLAGTF